ncbi:non-ribosomal peptide synthetase [Streptomyces sp. NPDC050164]|uniref:non-ribosomal peptide synthetase n=1 Tax=Streptomyces sp. NPDC050164 TaxID=3365605 RepID=UPI0037B98CC2
MITAQAARAPEALAVTDAYGDLTYRRLDGWSDTLAGELRARGVRRETPVGLWMERSLNLAVAFLAVLKTGATAHLLDPRWPAQRTAAVLAALPPQLLMMRPGTPPPQGTPEDRILYVRQPPGGRREGSGPTEPVAVHPDNLAYVVHTSGSTGAPKPVGVTHRSVSHCVATHRAGHRIVPTDRASWLAPPGSSAGVGELWPYLASGASVHAGEPEVVASPAELRDWLLERGITKAFLSAPTAQELSTLPWPADAPLSLVTVGGDRVLRWPPATLPFEVAVSYGSAEANGVTSCLVPWSGRITSRSVTGSERTVPPPVGRAWPDVRLLILDEQLNPLSAGRTGELFVASPELTRGYLGRPALTAERLLPNPCGTVPGERMYRTSDLAAVDNDGVLRHHGRTDSLIKVRGHRVDPGDIEATLLDHAGVEAAAVISGTDDEGTWLAAYVVPAATGPGAHVSPAALRLSLLGRLPDHLVPEAIVMVRRLPRNANGKLDRAALPLPDRRPRSDRVPPPRAAHGETAQSATAEQVQRIWQLVLDVEHAEPADNFLECGGTSVTAGRLVSMVRSHLGVAVRLRDFMRRPTLGELIDEVASRRSPH